MNKFPKIYSMQALGAFDKQR